MFLAFYAQTAQASDEVPFYTVISGTITEIETSATYPEAKVVTVFLGNSVVTLNIFEDIILIGEELEQGSEIAFLLRSSDYVQLSYPRVHNNPIIINTPHVNIFADYFYEEEHGLVSASNRLIINVNDETVVEDYTGASFAGSLSGERLIVFYDISTRSMPPIASPSRIIVLPSDEANEEAEEVDFTGYNIILNSSIGLRDEFIEIDGMVYVPFRVTLEALGFTVGWDAATGRIILDDLYITPELIIDGRSYASLLFFREELGFNNAYFHGGHVQINNEEAMQ